MNEEWLNIAKDSFTILKEWKPFETEYCSVLFQHTMNENNLTLLYWPASMVV